MLRIGATVFAAVLGTTSGSAAAELKVLTSNGTSAIVRGIGAEFAKRTGHVLTYKIDAAVLLQKEIERGEPFDVAVVTRAVAADLIGQGRVGARALADVARPGIGVATPAAAPKPASGTRDALMPPPPPPKPLPSTP